MKYFKVILCVIALLIFMSKSASSAPSIGIGSMYDVLIPNSQSMTKRIYNTGDSTAFVRIELHEIHTGGNEGKSQLLINNRLNEAIDKNMLIVTPQRLIIPPGSFQSIRILWPGSRELERYYRIRFIPVMPEYKDNFGLNKSAIDEYRKSALTAGLNVLTGYGTVVIIQPDQAIFNTIMNENTLGEITIRNKGNATVSLDNLRNCNSINSKCDPVTREFISPGHTLTIKKKSGYNLNFDLIEGGNKRIVNF